MGRGGGDTKTFAERAPPLVSAVFRQLGGSTTGHEFRRDGEWWPELVEQIDSVFRRTEDWTSILAVLQTEVLATYWDAWPHMYAGIETVVVEALAERSTSPFLDARFCAEPSVHVEIRATARTEGSARAFEAIGHALAGMLSHLTALAHVRVGSASPEGVIVDVHPESVSFEQRLANRHREGDLFALGLAPDTLLSERSEPSSLDTSVASARELEIGLGLTPTQSRIVRRLALGLALKDAAVELRMEYSTARTHLKQIFRRVGVSTQAALLLRVMNRRGAAE
jgi:DNA-binding CsgD family transcriptional regulator